MSSLFRRLYLILTAAGAVFVYWMSPQAGLTQLLDAAKSMLDVAALVFAVSGGWLALFFPEDFSQIFAAGDRRIPAKAKELKLILVSLLLSGLAALLALAIVLAAPFAKVFIDSMSRDVIARVTALGLFFSAVCLSYAFLSAIAPGAVMLVLMKNRQLKEARRRRIERD